MTDSIAATMAGNTVDRIAPALASAPVLDPFDRMLLTARGTVTTCSRRAPASRSSPGDSPPALPRSTGC